MKPISKSQFNLSLQCKKAFWLYRHEKGLMKHSASQLKIMNSGTNFGLLMQGLFPGGTDVSIEAGSFPERISLTKDLIEDRTKPIYEATLTAEVDGIPLLCMVDILVPDENGWHIYEVKSATSVKSEYWLDAGFQKFVAEKMGLHILSVNIIHVNNGYVRNGDLKIEKLGKIENITEVVKIAKLDYKVLLVNLEVVDSKNIPDVKIGEHCTRPYTCGFKDYCWKVVPKKDSVFDFFSRKQAFKLYNQDLATMSNIPIDFPFKGKNHERFKAYKNDNLNFDVEKINGFLNQLTYPVYYMDFETFTPVVPLFDRSRPYQQICFQYSVHIQNAPNDEIEHREFLADGDKKDPRIPLIENLIKDMGTVGSVVVYNATFESLRLKEIARDFPKHRSACENMMERIVDLWPPFRILHVYHPKMKGSSSLKSVLPALIPHLSYDGLDVSQGGEAMEVYENMVNNRYSMIETQKLRAGLLEYCKLDTLAMVELVEWLKNTLKQKLNEQGKS